MKCPRCGSMLVQGEYKRYETLSEHVMVPNATTHPPRPTWVCPKSCLGPEQFFDRDGDSYGMKFEDYQKFGSWRANP